MLESPSLRRSSPSLAEEASGHDPASREAARAPLAAVAGPTLEVRNLTVKAGDRPLLRRVDLRFGARRVFALVGPSGAGKSTLLKCLNRLVDLEPGLSVEGQVSFDGQPLYRSGVDLDGLRRRIGMLFQQPVIFPGSILGNALFGLRRQARPPRRRLAEVAEEVLREVGLWAQVKDRLGEPAGVLSVGQQQRLCLARTLALKPEVLLMDEPTSALDPASSRDVEELILRLRERQTVVLVTHNLGQARRLADEAACLFPRDGAGEILEQGPMPHLFQHPQSAELAEYLSRESL